LLFLGNTVVLVLRSTSRLLSVGAWVGIREEGWGAAI
jgi:hypothetical protein